MPDKANSIQQEELDLYSQGFAHKLTDYYFIDHKFILGKDILTFCDIKQVNLQVIKHLFDKWQAETGKWESPYFDYSHEEVKNALKIFMNVLSQHIKISKEDFLPLLKAAVKDSLILILNPKMYYMHQIERFAHKGFSMEYFQDLLRYIQYNKELLKAFLEKMEQKHLQDTDSVLQALDVFEDVYSDNERFIEPMDWRIRNFSDIFPLSIEKILSKIPAQFISNPIITNTASLDEKLEDIIPESTIDLSKTLEMPFQEIILEETSSTKTQTDYTTPKSETLFTYQEDEHEDEADNRILLNDILKNNQESKASILNQFQQAKIDNIRAAISLNQKFSFINKLFNGNNFAFNDALDKLDSCTSFEQARRILNEEYSLKFNWDFESEEVKNFMELVERKF